MNSAPENQVVRANPTGSGYRKPLGVIELSSRQWPYWREYQQLVPQQIDKVARRLLDSGQFDGLVDHARAREWPEIRSAFQHALSEELHDESDSQQETCGINERVELTVEAWFPYARPVSWVDFADRVVALEHEWQLSIDRGQRVMDSRSFDPKAPIGESFLGTGPLHRLLLFSLSTNLLLVWDHLRVLSMVTSDHQIVTQDPAAFASLELPQRLVDDVVQMALSWQECGNDNQQRRYNLEQHHAHIGPAPLPARWEDS